MVAGQGECGGPTGRSSTDHPRRRVSTPRTALRGLNAVAAQEDACGAPAATIALRKAKSPNRAANLRPKQQLGILDRYHGRRGQYHGPHHDRRPYRKASATRPYALRARVDIYPPKSFVYLICPPEQCGNAPARVFPRKETAVGRLLGAENRGPEVRRACGPEGA